MATFQIVEGPPGQGKSLYTSYMARKILRRNKKWEKKGNPRRILYSNLKFSEKFEAEWEGYIQYWVDANDLVKLQDCDIVWDEIATELDARNWINLSIEMKRFLSQYRKRGIDIYANTQDFSMIDQRARLMISGVASLTKLCGSRDISTTKPNPKFVWGVIIIRDVENFRETTPDKKKHGIFPSWLFITKELISIYDTRQDIPLGKQPPLKHTVVYCEHYGQIDPETGRLHDCQFHKVIHS